MRPPRTGGTIGTQTKQNARLIHFLPIEFLEFRQFTAALLLCAIGLLLLLAAGAAAQAQTSQSAPSPQVAQWITDLQALADASTLKAIATIASAIGAAVGVFVSILAVRKNSLELAILKKRAENIEPVSQYKVSLIDDPRFSLGALIVLDFLICTIITWLTGYALEFVSAPFSGAIGRWVFIVPQAIIVAILFWPIARNAKRLKQNILDPGK